MYGDKSQAQECIFQQSQPFKIKNYLVQTMVGPQVATKPLYFHSAKPLNLLSLPLENLEALLVIASYTCKFISKLLLEDFKNMMAFCSTVQTL